jgi:type V secretory pathway adhesin AidA
MLGVSEVDSTCTVDLVKEKGHVMSLSFTDFLKLRGKPGGFLTLDQHAKLLQAARLDPTTVHNSAKQNMVAVQAQGDDFAKKAQELHAQAQGLETQAAEAYAFAGTVRDALQAVEEQLR